MTPRLPRPQRWLLLGYAALLWLYPPGFRRGFSRDLLDCFEDLLLDQARRSRLAVAAAALRTALEMPSSLTRAWLLGFRDHFGFTARRSSTMDRLFFDLRLALRSLARNPLYVGLTVASLAIGVGATTTVLAAVDAILRGSPAIPDADRLARIVEVDEHGQSEVAYGNFLSLREQSDEVFRDVALHVLDTFALQTPDGAQVVHGELVSANYFETLQIGAARGSFFSESDAEAPSSPLEIVISHRLWSESFGGEEGIIGRTVRINDRAATVVAVAERQFFGTKFGLGLDLWVPVRPWGRVNGWDPDFVEARAGSSWLVFARRHAGVTLAEAQQQLDVVAARLAIDYEETNRSIRFAVYDNTMGDAGPHAGGAAGRIHGMALAASILVLLVAAANVTALQLARAVARRRECDIYSALGAGRGRMLRQPLLESLLLALASAAVGIGVAFATGQLFFGYLPDLPYRFAFDLAPDRSVIAITGLLTVAAALLLGTLTAVVGSRLSRSEGLPSTRGGTSRGTSRGLSALVVAMVSVSFVILVMAGLFRQSLGSVRALDPGFEQVHRLRANLDTSLAGDDDLLPVGFYEQLVEELEAAPGIRRAAVTSVLPLGDRSSASEVFAADRVYQDEEVGSRSWRASITPGYFETLSTPVLEGRAFDRRDDAESTTVVVNRTLADRLWPKGDVIGRRIRLDRGADASSLEVVGVVADGRYRMMTEPATPALYLPFAAAPRAFSVVVADAAAGDTEAAETLRRVAREIDPRVPVFQLRTLSAHVESSLWVFRLGADLAAALALLALVLSVAGLYGVTTYRVGRRRRELAIRLAVGARSSEILGQVVGQGLKLSALGVALGMVLAAGIGAAVSSLLVGVGARDVSTYLVVAALLGAITLLAALRPGLLAARIDPAKTLHSE